MSTNSLIFFFPKYSAKGPSSRYRIYNFLGYYEKAGYKPIVYPLFDDWYLNCIWKSGSKFKILHKIIWAYFKRLVYLIRIPNKSVIYIGAELFPYLPYGFERIISIKKIKYIIEFDDAIFHNYDSNNNWIIRKLLCKKTSKVIAKANQVITGSAYLTKYAKKFNTSVHEIPTCIEGKKYQNVTLSNSENYIIGWIGSKSQSIQVLSIIPALRQFNEKYEFQLHLIGFDKKLKDKLRGIPIKIIEWKDDTEILEMSKFSVGIMPLKDTPFNKGKCAFKLIQYMAIGIPTISTPLESNLNVNMYSDNIFANNNDEWFKALEKVFLNRDYFAEVGKKNRTIAFNNYTIKATFDKHLHLIESLK